jgi:hypothetical protein
VARGGALLSGARRRPRDAAPGPCRRGHPDRLSRPDPHGRAVLTRGRILGFDLAEIDLPGADFEAAPGGPPLPARTVLLRVPWGVAATVSAKEGPARSLGVLKPVPFPRIISDEDVRSSFPQAAIVAALSGPAYAVGAAAPARPRSMGAVRDMAAGGERPP